MAPPHADILFADDFDDEDLAPPPEPTPEIVEPIFTDRDLADAHEAGRLAGFQQAEAGMAAARNRLLAETAAALATATATAAQAAQDLAQDTAQDVARAMLAATARLLPFVCAHQGEREIHAIAAFLLPRLRDEPALAIHVNPAQHPALQQDLAALLQDGIELAADANIPPGDIRIAWHKGAATRTTAPVLQAVTQALMSLHLLEHDPLSENGDA